MVGWISIVGEERGFVCYGWMVRVRFGVIGSGFGCDGGWENEGWGIIVGKIWVELVRCCLWEGCYWLIFEVMNLIWRS